MNEKQTPQQPVYEDEIDLRELINVVIKRKKLILGIFFASVIITIIISFLIPRTYLSTAIIQTGIADTPLIKIAEAEQMIKTQDFLNSIIKELELKVEPENLKSAINLKEMKDTDLIQLEIGYQGMGTSYKLLRAIVGSFLAKNNELYQQRMDYFNQQMKELDSQINSVQSNITRTQELIQNLFSSGEISERDAGVKIILLQNTLPSYYDNLMNLSVEKNNLRLILIKSREFKLVDLTKPKPIKPNKKLNVALAGVLSLMFATFLAFFIEFWQKQNPVIARHEVPKQS
jgi:capsular polysaccharide biosynthesis protein